jgi:hypothetical protein
MAYAAAVAFPLLLSTTAEFASAFAVLLVLCVVIARVRFRKFVTSLRKKSGAKRNEMTSTAASSTAAAAPTPHITVCIRYVLSPSVLPPLRPAACEIENLKTQQNNFRARHRIRPPSAPEQSTEKVVEVIDEQSLVFDPWHLSKETRKKGVPLSHRPKNITYGFDHVFGDKATQEEVYHGATDGIVASVLDGYNATVFAYGATGSG